MASRRQLGEILIDEAVVSREVIEGALRLQRGGSRRKLGQLLVESGRWIRAG